MRHTLTVLALAVLTSAASCQGGTVSAADAKAELVSARKQLEKLASEWKKRHPSRGKVPEREGYKQKIDRLHRSFESALDKASNALSIDRHAKANIMVIRKFLNLLKADVKRQYSNEATNDRFYNQAGYSVNYFVTRTSKDYSRVIGALQRASRKPDLIASSSPLFRESLRLYS